MNIVGWGVIAIATAISATACSAGPDEQPGEPRRHVIATIAHDIQLAADATVVSARVTAGATLASILKANAVLASDVATLVQRTAAVFDVRKLRVRQPYRLITTPAGLVRRLDYEIDGDRVLRVTRDTAADEDDAFVIGVERIPKSARMAVVSGTIDRDHASLVAALDAAGETIDLTLALADVFSGEIDFSTEVQPGDRFRIAVEKQYRDDKRFAGYGPIVSAEFVNGGRRVRAFRFTPEDGEPGYYDEHGVSMRRFFLASPLKFQPVVTSAFSRRRLHPVLREYRAHLGVDYRAPAGAPVVAVADGTVVSAGVSGGAGRLVHLRHANGFETEYLHLSAISVTAGRRVRQGDVIGRVGSSGLATGAHLDYRVKKDGVFVNPIAAHRLLPPAPPIAATDMVAFVAARNRAMAALSTSAVARVANSNGTVQ